MASNYTAKDITVLEGLEPVRKRPGMYTTTERPNHLAQEVIDNSADEAIAGYADEIVVTLHDDGSETRDGIQSSISRFPVRFDPIFSGFRSDRFAECLFPIGII